MPNLEVRYIYKNTILQWFERKIARSDLTELHRALLEGDENSLTLEFNRILIGSISYYDSVEAFYHGFVVGLLRSIAGAIVSSNRESGHGRLDILIKILGAKEDRAIILELKVAKNINDLESSCNLALKQVEERDYTAELTAEGYLNPSIMKYGISFCKKKCLVKVAKS